jgi:hypothetical protein
VNQPLIIDRLPVEVHDEICRLHNSDGKSYEVISQRSALPLDRGGFVPWATLSDDVLKLFPKKELAASTLHRWYDLRVAQVRRDTLARSDQARKLAVQFAKSSLVNANDAVINAARDIFFGVLAEDGTATSKVKAASKLVELGALMQKAKTNEIRERKVAVDEQTLTMKLDLVKKKTGELLRTIEGEEGKPAAALTREELLGKVREIYGVA